MRRAVQWAGAVALIALGTEVGAGQAQRPILSGSWEMNPELSTVGGGRGSFEGDRDDRRGPPAGGRGRGGMGGGPRPGGFGGGGGMPRGGRTPPNAQEMESRRALLDEAMALPRRFTLIQKDDAVTLVEPDGVARTYATDNRAEKHQLTNGVIETRTKWSDGGLTMELAVGGVTMTRTFAMRDGTARQLEVTTRPRGGPRDGGMVTVYDEGPQQ
jgi:hypothetical protein